MSNFQRFTRQTQELVRYIQAEKAMVAAKVPIGDPGSYTEAVGRPNHDKWREAMEEEVQSIDRKGVSSPMDLRVGRKVIATRRVYHKTTKANG